MFSTVASRTRVRVCRGLSATPTQDDWQQNRDGPYRSCLRKHVVCANYDFTGPYIDSQWDNVVIAQNLRRRGEGIVVSAGQIVSGVFTGHNLLAEQSNTNVRIAYDTCHSCLRRDPRLVSLSRRYGPPLTCEMTRTKPWRTADKAILQVTCAGGTLGIAKLCIIAVHAPVLVVSFLRLSLSALAVYAL